MAIKRNRRLPIVANDSRLAMVRRVSKLMDEQFSIGGFKFGWDPVINLIPIVGDISGYIISVALIITMLQYGASGKVVVKMLTNATLDAIVGSIPFLGWVFDFFFKANTRNLKLLTQHYTEGKHQGSAKQHILLLLAIIILILGVIIYLSVKTLLWLNDKITPLIFN